MKKKKDHKIDKHLDLFYDHYRSQSKKSVTYAKNWCGAIAGRLKYDTSMPENLRQDLIEIFSTGADGQSIDAFIGLVPKRGQKKNNDPAIMFERDYDIWNRVTELLDNNPVLSDWCAQLEDEFFLGARRIEQIYSDMQKNYEEMNDY